MTSCRNNHQSDACDGRRRNPLVSLAETLLSLLLLSTLCNTFAEGRTVPETKRGIRGTIDGSNNISNNNNNNAKSQQDRLRHHRKQRRLPITTSESALGNFLDDIHTHSTKKSKQQDKGGVYDNSDEYYEQYYGTTGESATSENNGSEIVIAEGDSSSSSSTNGKDNNSKSGVGSTPDSSSSSNANESGNGKETPSKAAPSALPLVVSAPTQAPFINDLLNSIKNNDNSKGSPPTPSPKGSETREPFIFNSDGTSSDSKGSDASSTNNDAATDNGTAGDGVDGNNNNIVLSKTEICLAVFSKEPKDARDSTTTTVFSISVDVMYQTESVTSSNIESQLDDQNLAMALWIAGCREEAEAINNSAGASDTGKRRELQEEASTTPLITYSEVESWQTAGPCKEEGSDESSSINGNVLVDELLESSSPLCQQEFTSTIQIQTDGSDASSEYLTNQITEAFDTVKSFIESQQGVIAIAIEEINEEERVNPEQSEIGQEVEIDQIIQSDKNESKTPDDDNRITIIIACSIVGVSVLVCIVCLVLIFVYEKRRKAYGLGGWDGLSHVPFNNDDDNLRDNENENDAVKDLVFISTHKMSRNRTSDTDEDSGNTNDNDDDFTDCPPPPPPPEMGNPCYNAPDPRIPSPFDECVRAGIVCSAATCQKCEAQRQEGLEVIRRKITLSSLIKSIDSSAPANVPMDTSPITITTPRKERLPLTAEIYKRPYGVEDMVEL